MVCLVHGLVGAVVGAFPLDPIRKSCLREVCEAVFTALRIRETETAEC